jgi:glycosyltransferase involved in cell wall biosynthesis
MPGLMRDTTMTETVSATHGPPTVDVIMCTYARTARLATTLRQLAAQQGCRAALYIWNNNPAESARIQRTIASSAALAETHVHHSRENRGGYGRFFIARDLAASGLPVVFIDDDTNLPADAISSLLAEYEPRLISSFWAFRFTTLHNYYSRRRVRAGAAADYCGTAGMICDSALFADPGVFACPDRYRMLEDMWLSYFALRNGFRLIGSASKISLMVDGLDSSRGLDKNDFFKYLIMNGWPVAVSGRQLLGAP